MFTRIENRVGELSANPYLFIASQIVCGLKGEDTGAEPWAASSDPCYANHPLLPTSLSEALRSLSECTLFREQFGDIYIDYFCIIKRAEIRRYEAHLKNATSIDIANGVSSWERDEH